MLYKLHIENIFHVYELYLVHIERQIVKILISYISNIIFFQEFYQKNISKYLKKQIFNKN